MQFDDINLIESRGNSNYHSLQVRLQQRLTRGLAILSSYTHAQSIHDASHLFPPARAAAPAPPPGPAMLSSHPYAKAIDDASNFFTSAGDPNFPQDSLNPRLERGRSNFDVRHRLSPSFSYGLPLGLGPHV